MLTAALDAGGDESRPILAVAGFVSSVSAWNEFSKLWTERLAEEKIRYFHAVEAAHFNGEFRPWKERADREKWRRDLFKDLMDIIKRNTFRHFSCSIVNTGIAQMNEASKEEFHLCAYSIGGRICERRIREWFLEEWRHTKATMELVFEDGDLGKGKLQARLAIDPNCFQPIFRPKLDTTTDEGVFRPGFVPLQAADWLAYELAIATRDLIEERRAIESTADLRWPLQQFLEKPGNHGVFTVANMEEFERKIEMYKELKNWWRKIEK